MSDSSPPDVPRPPTAFDSEQFRHLYPPGIQRHYWTSARNRIVEHQLQRTGLNAPRILEVGCGKGIVVEYLRERDWSCFGVDLAPVEPLPSVRDYLMTGVDALLTPEEVRSETEVLLLLDVLEHLADPIAFLRKLLVSYPRASRLIVTVPARPELWSNFDELNRHQKRYITGTLREEIEGAGLLVRDLRYLFRFLYLPAWCLVALGGGRSETIHAPGALLTPLHRALSCAGYLDYRFLPRRAPGTSLLCRADVPPRCPA